MCLLTAVLLTQAFVADTHAQSTPAPKLNILFPPGGKAGSTFEVTATGVDLGDVETLYFSFPGVKVELGDMGTATIPAAKKGATKGMAAGAQSTQKFTVTLPPAAPLGIHDVYLVSKSGVSNPRAFVVGDLAETTEKEPNDDAPPKSQKVDMNATVNGVISTPTDVDYYVFPVAKGQRIVLSCLTSSIDSRLPAYLELYANGKYIGSNKNYANNDALLDYTATVDGEAYVRVASFSYTQGGPDYFYRLSVTTNPWIDAVIPASVEPGKDAKVTVYGRNLPGGAIDPKAIIDGRPIEKMTTTVKAPGGRAGNALSYSGYRPPVFGTTDGFDLQLKGKSGASNPYLLTSALYPVTVDTGTNTSLEKAMSVKTPCEITGTIATRGESDYYRFSAKKGESIAIDAFGDRRGSDIDLRFQILKDNGDPVTEQDESNEQPLNYFYNRSDDPPHYRFNPTADGDYILKVSTKDGSINFGPRCLYIVRLGPDQPDFRLVAMPGDIQAPAGMTTGADSTYAYNVLVLKTGDFNANITVTGEDLPKGITVKPQIISSTLKVSSIGVTVEKSAPPYVGPIKLVGTAVVGGQKVQREVRAATISWPVQQNNVPTLTRLNRELMLGVRDTAAYGLVPGAEKVTVALGETIKIPVKLLPIDKSLKPTVQVSLATAPPGFSATPLSLAPGKEAGTLSIDQKAQGGVQPQAGIYTVILRGQTNPVVKPGQKPQGPPNITQHSFPVTVVVTPKGLGKFTVGSAVGTPAKVAPGQTAEIPVRVQRSFTDDSPTIIETTVPPTAKGIKVDELKLQASEEDGKLKVHVPAGTPPGQHILIVKAKAPFAGVEVVSEAKLTIVVTK
jgi:hypothetical protein